MHLLEERLKSELKLIRSESSVQENKTKSMMESRLEQFKFQCDSSVSNLIDSALAKIEPRDSESIIRIDQLESEISKIRREISEKISEQQNFLHAVATTGHRHDWMIANALNRLKSLGVMNSAYKFINSEQFSVGPYRNLMFRFYPVSAPGLDCPAVWLVQRPTSAEALIPVFVDVGIGSTKKGPLRAKKVQELFGHWVWEATFPNDVLTQELAADDLVVSVEISMRQWMDPPTEITAPVVAEDDIPDSPSRMSNFTFVPHAEPIRAPSLPVLRNSSPATGTPNPFSKDDAAQAVTPRRSSWAQFGGSPDENTPVPSNPFR
jgi:hypothetical protein